MKYVLSTLAIMILAVFAVVLLGRNTNNSQTVQTGEQKVNMTEFINDESRVEFVQYGRVVSNEERRTLRIVVEENSRMIEILKGYQGEIERRETFTNNREAYDVFMNALNDAGFTREKADAPQENSGLCPTGRRFNYELKKNEDTISKLWNTSCSPSRGSFGGNSTLTRQLFQKQIPDYNTVVQGITF
jgi:hypothetical protein